MPLWVWITLIAIALVCLTSLIYSIVIRKKAQQSRLDVNVNNVTAKHPVLANPIMLMYVLFTISIIILIALFYGYY